MRSSYFKANDKFGWGDPLLINLYRHCITHIGELGGTFWTRARATLHCLFIR